MKMREGLLQLRYNQRTGKWYKDKVNGKNPWQMTVYFLSDSVCPVCGDRFFYCSGNVGSFCSESCSTTQRNYTIGISKETAKKISISNTGKKKNISYETQERLSKLRSKRFTGSGNPSWKGGITSENGKIWNSREYKNWRKSVFERDNYTCALCGSYGRKLEAHHILKFSVYRDKIFDITNGVTLCTMCHHNKVNHNEDMFIEQFTNYINNLLIN